MGHIQGSAKELLKLLIRARQVFKDRQILFISLAFPVLASFSLVAVFPSSLNYSMLFVSRSYYDQRANSETYNLYPGFIPPLSTLSLISILPNFGYNTGIIQITGISGTNFVDGLTIKLVKSGETDIAATDISFESASKITCKFDLTGKRKGSWDLVVTNPDDNSVILTNAFTVNSWAVSGLLVNYPNPFDPVNEETTVIYELSSDKEVSMIVFDIAANVVLKRSYRSGTNGGRAGENSVKWDGRNDMGEMVGNGLYFCRVVDKGSGTVLAKGRIAVLR